MMMMMIVHDRKENNKKKKTKEYQDSFAYTRSRDDVRLPQSLAPCIQTQYVYRTAVVHQTRKRFSSLLYVLLIIRSDEQRN